MRTISSMRLFVCVCVCVEAVHDVKKKECAGNSESMFWCKNSIEMINLLIGQM